MQIEGQKVEAVTDFIFLGSKNHCRLWEYSGEIKTCFLLWRKVMTTLDSVLKRRGITLLTKVWIVKVMVFPVVMYRCESETIKKAESQRIDAFKRWCCRRLESLLVKEMKPKVNPKGYQPWIFTGSTDTEAEAEILWPSDVKSQHIGEKPWCWEGLKSKGREGGRWWDG